jgi:hypothetical protein
MAFLLYSYSFLIMGHPCHHVRPNFPHLSKTRLNGRSFRELGKKDGRPAGTGRRVLQSGLRAPSHGPNGAVADSLDEAKAAFRAASAVGARGGRDMLGLSLLLVTRSRRRRRSSG